MYFGCWVHWRVRLGFKTPSGTLSGLMTVLTLLTSSRKSGPSLFRLQTPIWVSDFPRKSPSKLWINPSGTWSVHDTLTPVPGRGVWSSGMSSLPVHECPPETLWTPCPWRFTLYSFRSTSWLLPVTFGPSWNWYSLPLLFERSVYIGLSLSSPQYNGFIHHINTPPSLFYVSVANTLNVC